MCECNQDCVSCSNDVLEETKIEREADYTVVLFTDAVTIGDYDEYGNREINSDIKSCIIRLDNNPTGSYIHVDYESNLSLSLQSLYIGDVMVNLVNKILRVYESEVGTIKTLVFSVEDPVEKSDYARAIAENIGIFPRYSFTMTPTVDLDTDDIKEIWVGEVFMQPKPLLEKELIFTISENSSEKLFAILQAVMYDMLVMRETFDIMHNDSECVYIEYSGSMYSIYKPEQSVKLEPFGMVMRSVDTNEEVMLPYILLARLGHVPFNEFTLYVDGDKTGVYGKNTISYIDYDAEFVSNFKKLYEVYDKHNTTMGSFSDSTKLAHAYVIEYIEGLRHISDINEVVIKDHLISIRLTLDELNIIKELLS